LSVVISPPSDLQVISVAKRLYNIFSWGREIKKVGNHCTSVIAIQAILINWGKSGEVLFE